MLQKDSAQKVRTGVTSYKIGCAAQIQIEEILKILWPAVRAQTVCCFISTASLNFMSPPLRFLLVMAAR